MRAIKRSGDRYSRFGRRLRFESLEPRQCLAGNVTAALVAGDLVIDGDAEANNFSIVQGATDGEFILLGADDSNGVPTSVNGQPNGVAILSGVTGNVRIRLGDGADVLQVANFDRPKKLTIDGGAGDDWISAADLAIAELSIDLKTGAPNVYLERIDINGNLSVDAAKEDAPPFYGTFSIAESKTAGDASFNIGTRAGAIHIQDVEIGKRLTVDDLEKVIAVYYGLNGTLDISMESVTVGEGVWIQSSAVTVLDASNVFCGGQFGIVEYGSSGQFSIRDSRVLGDVYLSTVRATQPLHIGSTWSDCELTLSGVIVEQGMETHAGGQVNVTYSRVSGGSSIQTYGHDDSVLVYASQFDDALSVLTGTGNDSVEFIHSVVVGPLQIFHDAFTSKLTSDPQHYQSIEGPSDVTFTACRLGEVNLRGGNGTDRVFMNYCLVDQMTVDSRTGSDLIELVGARFSRGATIDGGDGFDLFTGRYNDFQGLSILNVEAVGT